MKLDSIKLTSLGISLQSEKSRNVLPIVSLGFAGNIGQPLHLVFCLASQAVFASSCGFYATFDVIFCYYILVVLLNRFQLRA